jgi:transposase InsO family protein
LLPRRRRIVPWEEKTKLSVRHEFVIQAMQEGSNIRGLCRRYGISSKTGYKWLRRFKAGGATGLEDRSRRPHRSPARTIPELEQKLLSLRRQRPAWGGRKLHRRLLNLGAAHPPAPSTITAILKRNGLLDVAQSAKHRAFVRFERPRPNDLWQMDFKGPLELRQGKCNALTLLDDHSRFSLGLRACPDQLAGTVKGQLSAIFARYGLPWAMLMDNGSPWGADAEHPFTIFTVWLMRLGIRVIHGRPYHPQTQGKEERFHRTLELELLRYQSFRDLAHCQREFDRFRDIYNLERPHQAIDLETPALRYRPSARLFPLALAPIEYPPGDLVRVVGDGGRISFHNHHFRVGKGFRGYPIGLRPTTTDGLFQAFFCQQLIAQIDLAKARD